MMGKIWVKCCNCGKLFKVPRETYAVKGKDNFLCKWDCR